ncbi:DNA-binding XRE family transcriptional regulator [Ruminiclostridium sufflavum DSM 19573]|uniref:DNA-binding XRE family transcriptional regulator n=1 Tax=Ruminiclostridium sufflavum DSM 19573 TaxID=1121337 RepID=A0A318XM05_9FIRM|nr:helix-turn-helix transcriptional regulator [Ruminiclostridium sufflavum]PYG86699.1 DNA-binding XRE family transcriptional regulator [Ruminiclostridium sufflavum DSM 19573]
MKFGEKLKDLRKEKGLNQTALAKEIGVSLRTVISYEAGKSYPKKREIYTRLAEYFDLDINYFLTEDEEFIVNAEEKYGNRAAKQAAELVTEIGGLFAGGELSEADKDAVMRSLQQAYWDAKEDNIKYTPKKYRK